MPATHSKKASHFLLITLIIYNTIIWELKISIVAVLQVEFFAYSGVYKTCCSTVRDRRCLILLLMMHHTFSTGARSGKLAGQSSTCTLCLRSHAVIVLLK